MREFHIIVRPLGASRLGESIQTRWSDTKVSAWTLADDSPPLAQQGFGSSYEDFSEQLSQVPRLYIEPDGSFVWVSSIDPVRRISGQITDDGKQVLYLELRGRCQWEDMTEIVRMIGWPQTELIFQMLPEALLVQESQFREVVCGEC